MVRYDGKRSVNELFLCAARTEWMTQCIMVVVIIPSSILWPSFKKMYVIVENCWRCGTPKVFHRTRLRLQVTVNTNVRFTHHSKVCCALPCITKATVERVPEVSIVTKTLIIIADVYCLNCKSQRYKEVRGIIHWSWAGATGPWLYWIVIDLQG